MRKVLATGTFEILHPGHLAYLKKARELGDELIVIIARDSMIKHKRKPVIPEKQRLKMVQALKIVDKALLGSTKDIFEPVKNIKPDFIVLGHDQQFDEDALTEELRKRGLMAQVVRIEYVNTSPLCSSAKIIKKIVDKSK